MALFWLQLWLLSYSVPVLTSFLNCNLLNLVQSLSLCLCTLHTIRACTPLMLTHHQHSHTIRAHTSSELTHHQSFHTITAHTLSMLTHHQHSHTINTHTPSTLTHHQHSHTIRAHTSIQVSFAVVQLLLKCLKLTQKWMQIKQSKISWAIASQVYGLLRSQCNKNMLKMPLPWWSTYSCSGEYFRTYLSAEQLSFTTLQAAI